MPIFTSQSQFPSDLQPVPTTTAILDLMALTIILISVLYQVATRRKDRATVRDTGKSTFGFLTFLGLGMSSSS